MRIRSGINGFLLAAIFSTASMGQTIIWTDQNGDRIQQRDVSVGPVGTIVQFPPGNSASRIHYDPVEAKLYYRFFGSPSSFQRSNLDGSDPENIPTSSLGFFTLNVDSRKLYWFSPSTPNVLNRSELDGSGVSSHTYATYTLEALEAFGEELFFGTSGDPKGIWRANPDGSNEVFLHEIGPIQDLAHDPVENKVYMATYGLFGISRINLDGTGFEVVVLLPQWQMGSSSPTQLVVDYVGRKVYWAEDGARVIRRSNLDGSNVEDFVTAADVGNPNFDVVGLTIVYSPNPIPALSTSAVLALAAIILTAGLLVLRRRAGLWAPTIRSQSSS